MNGLEAIERVSADTYPVGQKNIYTCDDGHFIVTVDRDPGVTPFSMKCRAPGCKKTAQSSLYRVYDQRMRAGWEWYRPSVLEVVVPERVQDHVNKGGLLLRQCRQEPST